MPAKSKAQRRFMAMVEHDPEMARERGVHMSKAQMHDFAATSEKRLPERASGRKHRERAGRRGQ